MENKPEDSDKPHAPRNRRPKGKTNNKRTDEQKTTRRNTNQSESRDKQIKPKSFWASWAKGWRASGPTKKVEIIITSIVALGGIGYLCAYITVSVLQGRSAQKEHRPRIILSRPIQILDPLIYDTKLNQLNSKRSRIWYLNTTSASDGVAKRSFQSLDFIPVPTKRVGDPRIDSPPVVDENTCGSIVSIPGAPFADVAPRQERFTELAQTAMKFGVRLVESGGTFQIYAIGCVAYSDEGGAKYGTCDRFRLVGPTGGYTFIADTSITGTFVQDIIGHCAN